MNFKEHFATSVIIVDDHPIVRAGLTQLINQESDLVVCGEAEDFQSAMRVMEKNKPNVAIVDISLKGKSGIDLIKQIKSRYPKTPVLVLSMHDEAIYAERAIRAGAKGYLMKQEGTVNLISAIRTVMRGCVCVSAAIEAKLSHAQSKHKKDSSVIDTLSDREMEVFRMLGQGLGTRKIAENLGISVKTIETHREHIKEKLTLSSATELIQRAAQWVLEFEDKVLK